VDIINESKLSRMSEDDERPDIKEIRLFRGYTEFKPLFNEVIKDLVESKATTLPTGPKADIILQAPCGAGKSSCFSIASQIFGGITVSDINFRSHF
jgi:superfamily II DNA helicase RecQ